jgi:hypothetical protein
VPVEATSTATVELCKGDSAPMDTLAPVSVPRRSVRLTRVVQKPPQQVQVDDSDFDLVYDNPEMPKNYFDEDIEYHDPESEGNGHGWEHVVNGHEGEHEVNVLEVGHERSGQIPHLVDPNSTQHLFRDATWSKSNNIYSPEPIPYSGGKFEK